MNKRSLRVWFVLATIIISFAFFVGDEVSAKITDNDYLNPTQSDTPTADVNSDTDSERASAAFGILDYVKVLLSLALVIGLLVYVLKFLNKKNIAYQQNNMLQSLGGVSVGPQKSVQIVKVGNRVLVVGVGDDVKLLADIDDEVEVGHLLALYEDQYNQPASKPYIFQLLSRNKEKQTNDVDEDKPFSEMLNSRLSEIKKQRSDELERWKDKENDNL
jgi:flagellar protein FliO/FliZ